MLKEHSVHSPRAETFTQAHPYVSKASQAFTTGWAHRVQGSITEALINMYIPCCKNFSSFTVSRTFTQAHPCVSKALQAFATGWARRVQGSTTEALINMYLACCVNFQFTIRVPNLHSGPSLRVQSLRGLHYGMGTPCPRFHLRCAYKTCTNMLYELFSSFAVSRTFTKALPSVSKALKAFTTGRARRVQGSITDALSQRQCMQRADSTGGQIQQTWAPPILTNISHRHYMQRADSTGGQIRQDWVPPTTSGSTAT